jgi:protein TonB
MAMSPAAARLLPRTQSFQRRRPLRAWWLAVIVAVAANLALVVVLSQVSHLHLALPEPPLSVRTLRQVEPEAPPPPPPEQREPPPEPAEEVPTVALPTLDLPSTAPASALVLPDVPNLVANLDLPLSVPAFSTIAPVSAPAAAPAGAALGEPDQAAERLADFDLDKFYPRAARLRNITGRSRVRIAIDAEGRVAGVEVLESTPPGVFEKATEQLGRAQRYRHPATRGGKPVPSTEDLIIDWTLK